MKKIYLIILMTAVIAACSPKIFAPTASSLPAMQQKVPAITLERAEKGYQLYTDKCTRCHHIYEPAKFTKEQWRKILAEMFPKAKIADTIIQNLIHDYLYSLSK